MKIRQKKSLDHIFDYTSDCSIIYKEQNIMDKPGDNDIAACVLDGVCSALRIVDVAFL